ncbi:MAG: tetratricopeptide repeat protein [Bdellovibrionales bacterium]|nr:tetratricopeptide repeat protein [Bdellovibrionales bacterium]
MIQMTESSSIQDLLSTRHYQAADQWIRDQLQKNPKNAGTHYWAGVSAYFQNKIPEAVSHLRSALDLDPKHTDAAICLSVLMNDIGNYDEAKKIFDQANQSVLRKSFDKDVEIDRKFAIKHLEVADLYFRYRRYDAAIEEYTKAIHLDPTALEIRIRRAKAFAKKGFLTRAIQELQILRKEQPSYLQASLQLGLLYYSQQNLIDAISVWESVLAIQPGQREATAYLEMAQRSQTQSL